MILDRHQAIDRNWVALLSLTLLTFACLSPFLNKAFNIDDPLFLWVARHIQSNPLDFYGFDVNWYGALMKMSEVMKNPPGAAYYLAAAAKFFGWSEVSLHTAFLIPALAAVLGTYFLALEMRVAPMIAALSLLFSPVFILSSSTVMCDTMMAAFWVWSIFFWVKGIREDSYPLLVVSSVLVVFCCLTKYFGMSLIPLLFVYTLAQKKRLGWWAVLFLLPALVLAGYQEYTYHLYGKGLLSDASAYLKETHTSGFAALFKKTITGLSFTGGCLLPGLCYAPFLLRKEAAATIGMVTVIVVSGLWIVYWSGGYDAKLFGNPAWPTLILLTLFVFGGLAILVFAAEDLWKNRDADSLLLFLWTFGTVVFASYVNWTVNGRSILPMAAVTGILIGRRFDAKSALVKRGGSMLVLAPLLPSLLIALTVAGGDYRFANTQREAAEAFTSTFTAGRAEGGTLWFEGHWGFQYYMEAGGAVPIDLRHPVLRAKDMLVIPTKNTNVYPLKNLDWKTAKAVTFGTTDYVSTISKSISAGFYTDLSGILPFAFGRIAEGKYYVFMPENN